MTMFGLPVVLNVSDVISLVVAAVALGTAAILGLRLRARESKIQYSFNDLVNRVVKVKEMLAQEGTKMSDKEVLELQNWIKERNELEEDHKKPHTAYWFNMAVDEVVKTKNGEIWKDGKKVMESNGEGSINVVTMFTFDPCKHSEFTVIPYPVGK